VTSVWQRVVYNLREGGVRGVLRRATERASEWWRYREEWLIYHMRTEDAVPLDAEIMTTRSLAFDDLRRLGYFKALAFPQMIADRLTNGSTCHGFFVGDDLVNLAWTHVGHLELAPGFGLDVPDAVCIYDCVTLPGHRGKGYYPTSLRMLQHHFALRGIAEAAIAVDPGNRPSIVGIERAGFVRDGSVARTIRLGRGTVTVEGAHVVRQSR